MDKIDSLIDQARNEENFTFRKDEVLDTELEQLEKKYSIVLPDDYRYFLKKYGAVSWFGEVIPGLQSEKEKYKKTKDIYKLNNDTRERLEQKERFKKVPENGLIVLKYDGGGYYFMYAKGDDRDGDVALHLTENWGNEIEYWDNFTDFLSYLIIGEPTGKLG